MEPLVLLTGFGAFPGVERNPSREVAALLEDRPPVGLRVRSAELPVTFGGVAEALSAFVERWRNEAPVALVGLGVHPGTSFRVERAARGRLRTDRVDNAGECGSELAIDLGADRRTSLAVEQLAQALTDAGAGEVEVSDDAGQYVCEYTYHHILTQAEGLAVPGLFLHVPPLGVLAPEAQRPIVAGLLSALARQLG